MSETLEKLQNWEQYLKQFHESEQPSYFEELVASALAHVFYLPFYTINNDDLSVGNRVVWCGTIDSNTKKPQKAEKNLPDAIAYCYTFDLIIEATISISANQWAKEFSPSIRHCEEFVKEHKSAPNKIIILLISPHLHKDTYRSIRSHPRREFRFIPIELSTTIKILETSILAFTIHHSQIRMLFNHISECINSSTSLDNYRCDLDSVVSNWQKEVFREEKDAVIGVKSYKAMCGINRMHIGSTEIYGIIESDPLISEFLRIINEKLSLDLIEESLIRQKFAASLHPTFEDEKIFYPIPIIDIKAREKRLLEELERL